MYVVRRSFRNYNQMVTPGSVVEPGSIKRFKSHLRDRDIIEVTEHDFDKWNAYFIAKFGVPIGPLHEDTNGEPDGAPETQGTETQGTETQGTETQGTETQGTETQGTETQGTPVVKATVVVKAQ